MTYRQRLLDASIFIASEADRALDVANMPAEVVGVAGLSVIRV